MATSVNDQTEYGLREQNRTRLLEMLTLMGKFDHEKVSAEAGGYADGRYPDLYDERGRLDIPFMPKDMKNFREGPVEHRADAELRFWIFRDFQWVGEFEIHDCLDPSRFIVFATGRGRTRRGVPYENSYVFFATLRDGKILNMREYADTSRMMVLADDLADAGTFA